MANNRAFSILLGTTLLIGSSVLLTGCTDYNETTIKPMHRDGRFSEGSTHTPPTQPDSAPDSPDPLLNAFGDYAVILEDRGSNAIAVIKEVRRFTGLGLKESKELVDRAPSIVQRGISETRALTLKEHLETAGAKARIEKQS